MKIFKIIFILVISSLSYGLTIDEVFKARVISVKKDKYYQIEKLSKIISSEYGVNIIVLKSSEQQAKIKFPEEKISLYDFFINLSNEGALIQIFYKKGVNFAIYLPLNEINIEAKIGKNIGKKITSKNFIKAFEEAVNVEKAGAYELGQIAEVLEKYHNIKIINSSLRTEFCVSETITFLDFLERVSKFEKSIKLLTYFKGDQIIFQIESFNVKLKDNFYPSRLSSLYGCLGKNFIFADIREEELSFVFPMIESTFNKSIILEEDSIKHIKISYNKGGISMEEFLKEISYIAGVSFYFENDKIKIKKEKTSK